MMGAYCFCHVQADGESLTDKVSIVDDNGLTYVLDTKRTVTQGVPYDYREQLVELVWHHVPRDHAPLTKAFSYQNTINSKPFYLWSAGQVMLDGIKPEFSLEVDGTYSWKIRYRFRINTVGGFLFLPDPQNGNQFARVACVNDPTKQLYQSNDFNDLFRPV